MLPNDRFRAADVLSNMASLSRNRASRRQQRPLWKWRRGIFVAQGALNIKASLAKGIMPRVVQVQQGFLHMSGDVKGVAW